MNYVATLISPPGAGRLTPDFAAQVARALPAAQTPVWLDEGVAADIVFGGGAEIALKPLREEIHNALRGAPVDIVLAPNDAFRRKRLLLADMDSTMIGQECIDEMARFIGKYDHVAAITERAMNGEIAFEPALRERVALLRGFDEALVDEIIAERIHLTPGGRALVQTMRRAGAYTALVSGGFTVFTSRIGAMIGFDEHRSNTLLAEGGKFTGVVADPILGREAKLTRLRELRSARALDPRATLAVGDGANDLAMLGDAGLGIAFHAKPAVAAAAHARIDHCDLTALLFAQGYRREEFAE